MNIALTERHKRLIEHKVNSGAYGSAAEVVREGLRLLEEEDGRKQRITWLQSESEKGFTKPASPAAKKDSNRLKRLIAGRANTR